MLISAFTDALLKSDIVVVNALWTNVNKQWTTVFVLSNIKED